MQHHSFERGHKLQTSECQNKPEEGQQAQAPVHQQPMVRLQAFTFVPNQDQAADQ